MALRPGKLTWFKNQCSLIDPSRYYAHANTIGNSYTQEESAIIAPSELAHQNPRPAAPAFASLLN
jgi:hypothetical protein